MMSKGDISSLLCTAISLSLPVILTQRFVQTPLKLSYDAHFMLPICFIVLSMKNTFFEYSESYMNLVSSN